ncbi:MFS transporter [Methylobacterium sp. P31]
MPALDLTDPAALCQADDPADDRAASRRRLSTRLLFLIVGIANATWAPLVPLVKTRADLDAAGLGLLLLTFGIGSILAMPSAGAAAARLGFRPVLLAGTVAIGLALPVLAVRLGPRAAHPGAAAVRGRDGGGGLRHELAGRRGGARRRAADEVGLSRPLQPRLHPGGAARQWPAGRRARRGLERAAPGRRNRDPVRGGLARHPAGGQGRGSGGPAFALPRGPVLVLGLLCFVVFLTEGSALDWSAVFLIQKRGLDPAWAALGYAAFSVTMTAGRLAGDGVVARLGRRRVVVLGGLLAAAGLALSVLVPTWEAALAGYALVGAGCANIVPVLFTAAGRQTAIPESVAVPAVTTLGYAGVLAGPALIGFAAQALGLPAAFLLVAALLLGVAAAGRSLRV